MDAFLSRLDRLGHKARRQICPLYVSGLIGPGDRKSIAPIAKRLALGECDQLHHFIAAGVWDAKPVETELLVQADRLVGGSDAAKCRSCWRCGYFFPRVGRASGLGWSERVFRPNIERHGQSRMALADIDRVVAAGARLGCVLADAGYAGRGRPRQRHVPDILSIPAEDMMADAKWHTISWRTGTKGKLKARFAAVRVRVADGPAADWGQGSTTSAPGEEAWLIGEHRMSGEKKYYLANLPAKTYLRTLATTIKARWICEQAHQQLKEELGLDHFEGRSWQGLHRHALMTMIVYAFLQHRRLAAARREKRINGPPPQPTLPAVRQAIFELIARLPPQRCPHCRKWICNKQQHD